MIGNLRGLGAGLLIALVATEAACGDRDRPAGAIEGGCRPRALVVSRAASQRDAAPAASKRILFGDLHVHTTYSIDALVFSLSLFGGEGTHPLADACDFARHCSALDFFSINDHAEGLTPERWERTKQSIRECNALAGDPEDPDLVAFVGWEWTQAEGTRSFPRGRSPLCPRAPWAGPEEHGCFEGFRSSGLLDGTTPPTCCG